MNAVTAEPGTRFIAQGDEGDAMYILAVGQCKASISRPGQPDEEVARYKPGDYFGELALMDRAPRKANVDAVTDITCLRIAAREFDRVLGGTTAYAGMERKAVKSRAIAARVMAQTAAMASPRQPAAPAPAPAPAPMQQYVPPPAPAPAPLPAPAPALLQLPVSAPPPSVSAVAAALPPLSMASPARPPVQHMASADLSPAVPQKAPDHFTEEMPTVTVDGIQMTRVEYISSMGRKLATALM